MRRLRLWIWTAIRGVICAGAAFRFWPRQALAAPADTILVEKSARTLSLLRGGTVIASYRVALGRHPIGHKEREHDGRTPEGHYTISKRVEGSQFYRALKVS